MLELDMLSIRYIVFFLMVHHTNIMDPGNMDLNSSPD